MKILPLTLLILCVNSSHADELQNRVNKNFLNAQETGRVYSSDIKNEFNELIGKSYFIFAKGEHTGKLLYTNNLVRNKYEFKLISSKDEAFSVPNLSVIVNARFDGITKQVEFYPCKEANDDLCVLYEKDFKDYLVKAKTMQIGLPYKSGVKVADYNIAEIKKVL